MKDLVFPLFADLVCNLQYFVIKSAVSIIPRQDLDFTVTYVGDASDAEADLASSNNTGRLRGWSKAKSIAAASEVRRQQLVTVLRHCHFKFWIVQSLVSSHIPTHQYVREEDEVCRILTYRTY